MKRLLHRAIAPPTGMILALALFLSACVTAPGAVARGAPESFAPLVKKVLPAVVNIAVTETVTGGDVWAEMPPELRDTPLGRQFRRKFGAKQQQVTGAGSGFVIDPAGLIVTNNHVVGRADRIVVSLADGRQLPARIVGRDELTDIAVIKVDSPRPLPSVAWGDSRKTEVGDWIVVAGNPFGLGGSVSAGIVSAEGRDLGSGPFDNFIQIDAPINPGNSGGPVFNMDGQVIGVTSTIVSPTGASVGIGFAIPSEIAGAIVAQLAAHGQIERGWLGVSIGDPLPGGGLTIASLDRAGPAAKAGLRIGDILMAVNGDRIETANGLIKAVAAVAPGNTVRVTVRRQGQTLDTPVIVGRRPPEQAG